MVTLKLDTPKKYEKFLNDSNEFQGIITEVIYDYVEKKQDQITKKNLDNNPYFNELNISLEKKLWNL